MAFISCNKSLKIDDPVIAYQKKQYANALPGLVKHYKKEKSRIQKGRIAWKIAQSYKRLGSSDKASSWFKTAYDYQYGSEALMEYAYALKFQQQYQEALTAFKLLGQEIGSPYEYRREITACENGLLWVKQLANNPYKISSLTINSSADDYAPITLQKNSVVFTSDRKLGEKLENYHWTERAYSDLLVGDNRTGDIKNLEGPFNTSDNEGTITFDGNQSKAVFTRCTGAKKSDQYCSLYISYKNDGQWSNPEVLPFKLSSVNYMHATLSKDGTRLVFCASDPEGIGGYDLYMSESINNNWSQPKLLPRNINTPGDEKFPFQDSDTLYFSSTGLPGMGGLDVFKTYMLDKGQFSPPINLMAPINSGSDDFGFVTDPFQNTDTLNLAFGYLSSNRNGGLGGDDIYRWVRTKPIIQAIVKDTGTLTLEIFIVENIYKDAQNPNSPIIGRKLVTSASLSSKSIVKDPLLSPDNTGKYSIKLSSDEVYNFLAKADGYLTSTASFSSKGIPIIAGMNQSFELEILLTKALRNVEINLANIYYDYDKWEIRPDAIPTLNKLAQLLMDNPEIKIELGSHTDCRGSGIYNQDLSQKRAQSVVDYLTSKGIAAERMAGIGYGEDKPILECPCASCSEEEYQANRRTTFRILD